MAAYKEQLQTALMEKLGPYEKDAASLQELTFVEDLKILQHSKIIGMTTTGERATRSPSSAFQQLKAEGSVERVTALRRCGITADFELLMFLPPSFTPGLFKLSPAFFVIFSVYSLNNREIKCILMCNKGSTT